MKSTTKGTIIFGAGLIVGAAAGWTHGAFLGYKVADAKHLERLQENLRRLAEDLTNAQEEGKEKLQEMFDVDDGEAPYVKGEHVKEPIINDRIDNAPLTPLKAVKTTPAEDQPKPGPVQVAPDKSSGN